MSGDTASGAMRRHEKYDRLIAAARNIPAVSTAVAHPCDETSLKGALDATTAGIIMTCLNYAIVRAVALPLSASDVFLDVERISVCFAEAKCARHASSTMETLRLSSASM